MKLKNYYKKNLFQFLRPINFGFFSILNCMNRKCPERTFLNFFSMVFSFFRRSFRILSVNPPNCRSSKINTLPPPPLRSESSLIGLNSVGREVKHYAEWGGGGVGVYFSGRGGGLTENRKDPNVNFSKEFGTQKIGGGYHKIRLKGSGGFNKIVGVGIY